MAATSTVQPGTLLRDIRARTLDGRVVQTSDFRGRRNLLLIVPGADGEGTLLEQLRHATAELQEEEAVALISDTATVTTSNGEQRGPALYITDRYGEIHFAAQPGAGEFYPSVREVLEWLRFINAQCPE